MFNKNYGYDVYGYKEKVVNEREIRAGGGILFIFGILTLFNAVALDHFIIAQAFISFFVIDMVLRLFALNYSPTLLLGKFIVRNQEPEYVGANQKRFAWFIALILGGPIFYLTVLVDFVYTPLIVWICIFCLVLIFLETAFGICLGCLFYKIFDKDISNCPGGSCEIKLKHKSQEFSSMQWLILISFIAGISYGLYAYSTVLPNKTYFGEHIEELFYSQEELDKLEEEKFEKESAEFFNEED